MPENSVPLVTAVKTPELTNMNLPSVFSYFTLSTTWSIFNVTVFLFDILHKLLYYPFPCHRKYLCFLLVIPRHLNIICRCFWTFCLFHLHRQTLICLWRWNRQNVPKRWHIKFRCQGITQKKAYNIQNMAKVWNQEKVFKFPSRPSLHFLTKILNFVIFSDSCHSSTLNNHTFIYDNLQQL
jgi:hypothetical protein